MSNESEKVREVTLAEEQTESQLEQLMAAPPATLEHKARRAAAQWQTEEHGEEAPAEREPAAPSIFQGPRVDRWLWVMLLMNLALIGVVLVMPSTTGGHTAPAVHPGSTPPAKHEEPAFVSPARKLGGLPTSKLWDLAVRAAGRGEYAEAIALLEQYLATGRGMSELERRLVYNQLAHYLIQDGQLDKAQEYERKSHQLLSRTHLPEDLLESAHRAEQEGQLTAMRSAYARFLLQQRQVPPTLRHAIAEAYLKLGDSYRLEASGSAARQEKLAPTGSDHQAGKQHR